MNNIRFAHSKWIGATGYCERAYVLTKPCSRILGKMISTEKSKEQKQQDLGMYPEIISGAEVFGSCIPFGGIL